MSHLGYTFFILPLCRECNCDTRLVVRQADDLFVGFGAKPKQRLELEISRETGSGGGKEGLREERVT